MNNRQLSRRVDHQINRFGKIIGIQRFKESITSKNQFDEIISKEYKDPIYVKALVYFEPTEEMLNEAGMTKDETDVIAKISLVELRKKNLFVDNEVMFNQDDIIIIDKINYGIKTVRNHIHYKQHHIISIGALRA